MKRIFTVGTIAVRTLAGVVAAATLLAAASASASPDLGKPAPVFSATDSNGHKVSLADFRGNTVVLEWTNHDCPYVRRHYDLGNMQALQKEATGAGVVWLSVISSAPGTQGFVKGTEANQLTKARGAAPTKVVLDPPGTIGRMYGAQVTPHMYIIDGTGTLVYKGAIDDQPAPWGELKKETRNFVRLALADLKQGGTIRHPDTRAYGCTVKYAD
jgi:hypothetical protein